MQPEKLEKDYREFKTRVLSEHDRIKMELRFLRDVSWNLVKAVDEMREEFRAEMKEMRDEFHAEMKEMRDEFQAEMRDMRDEFQTEMKEMREEFRAEMKEMREEFQTELKEMRDEFQTEMKKMRQKWGEIAERMGTLAEDIFAPGVPYLVESFGYTISKRMLDVGYKKAGKFRQYDAIVVAEDEKGQELIFAAEVKSQARSEDFNQLKNALEDLMFFEPVYREKKIIPVLAAFRIPEDLINLANKRGVLLVRMGGEYLEPLNPEIVKNT
ncbi:hypothetical protein [Thermodesulfatator atlanticus]